MEESNLHSKIITFSFCAGLFCFFAVSLFRPARIFSESENRYLQRMPALSWDSLRSGKFGRQYETYLSDQFPLRDQWIALKVEAERARQMREINQVFLGRDGYLIEALYEEDLDAALVQKNLEALRAFAINQAEALGDGHMRIMLVPSASQILPDKLPPLAAPLDQNRLLGEFAPQEGVADFLVPVNAFLAQKHSDDRGAQLYYRTDHHWTAHGAYAGYEAWRSTLTPSTDPRPLSGFAVKTVSEDFYGTIHSKLNIPVRPDSIELYIPENAPDYDVYYDGAAEPVHTLYSMDALATKDKYRVYLDGNHGWTKIVNKSLSGQISSSGGRTADEAGATGRETKSRETRNREARNRETKSREIKRMGRLLIIKDSYAHSFAPLASLDFGEVHMLDLRYYNGKISDFIREQEITDILVLYSIPGFMKDTNFTKLNR